MFLERSIYRFWPFFFLYSRQINKQVNGIANTIIGSKKMETKMRKKNEEEEARCEWCMRLNYLIQERWNGCEYECVRCAEIRWNGSHWCFEQCRWAPARQSLLLFSLFSLMDSHNSTNVCVIHLGILNVIDDLAPIEFKMAWWI